MAAERSDAAAGRTASGRRAARLVKRLAIDLAVLLLGLGVGGLAIYARQIGGGAPLEIWHKARLENEFAAERAAEVGDFDGYLKLEERLFAELDEEVYAHTPRGPGFELARYSAGSLADPRGRDPDWNRSFELPGAPGGAGVLLLHGMSDSPYSLRALGQRLNEAGHWVLGVRLPGHGTVPAGLRTVTWEDMAAVVSLGMERLGSRVGSDAIHVIGYSTGAPLALDWVLARIEAGDPGGGASATMPASLVLVSPSIGITPTAGLTRWLDALAALPGLGRLAWTGLAPEFDPYKYNSFTANAAHQVHRLTRAVAARIERSAAARPLEPFPPTLVLLSAVDATVSVDAVIDNLLEHLAPPRHELMLFDVNRWSAKSSILTADPGPITARLMADGALPFRLTLIGNESPESREVVRRSKPALSSAVSIERLDREWPRGMISLSHISLQFPPDDPLYGRRDLQPPGALPLGQIGVQGERGLLRFPSDWLLRVRHNPFYDLVEQKVVDWVAGGEVEAGGAGMMQED